MCRRGRRYGGEDMYAHILHNRQLPRGICTNSVCIHVFTLLLLKFALSARWCACMYYNLTPGLQKTDFLPVQTDF